MTVRGTGGRPSVSVDEALEYGAACARAAGERSDTEGFAITGDWQRTAAGVLGDLRVALAQYEGEEPGSPCARCDLFRLLTGAALAAPSEEKP